MQLTLFRPGIQQRFELFLKQHPDVWDLFVKLSRDIRKSRDHYGARSIIEVLRWHYATSSSGEEPKINDNFISRFARKLMKDYPDEFTGFFELRKLTAS